MRRLTGSALVLAAAGCMGSPAMTTITPPYRSCASLDGTPVDVSVDWYHPVDDGDHERLQAWCETLGPLIAELTPAAIFRSTAEPDRLNVAVWNVNGGGGDLAAFIQRELGTVCDGPRSTLRPGAPHFVLLAQEALRRSSRIPRVPESWATPPPVSEDERESPRLDVTEVARACGLALFYAPAARNGNAARDGLREDKGNAILSTRPFSDLSVIELPYEAARRVVPVASVRTPAGDALRLASVHLITTPPPWRLFLTGNSARQRQARSLIAALAEIEGSRAGATAPDPGSIDCDAGNCPGPHGSEGAVPTVAAGDLNTFSQREVALRELRAAFPDSPPRLDEPTRPPFPTDHLLFRRGNNAEAHVVPGTYRRVDDDYYSDHHAVIATVAFRRTIDP